jgi:hypothetical protein
VFNATFNNISVISWWSILLVKETGVPGENMLVGKIGYLAKIGQPLVEFTNCKN